MVQPVPRTRLYCDQQIAAESTIQLDEAVAHRLRSVLRMTVGQGLRLFNAQCGEWLCDLTAVGKKQAAAKAIRQLRPPESTSNTLWLMFAPLKKDAMDVLVEKSVELGVDRLLPTVTDRTDVARVNVDRLSLQSVAAAEQSERLSVPEIDAPRQLSDRLKDWQTGRALIVCAEEGDAAPMIELATRFADQPVCIMIGPEGGIAKSELDAIAKLPFSHAAGLGPRVLRAETAAVAALAIWQTMAGTGKERPPFRS